MQKEIEYIMTCAKENTTRGNTNNNTNKVNIIPNSNSLNKAEKIKEDNKKTMLKKQQEIENNYIVRIS